VVLGGLARLLALPSQGWPGSAMSAALAMELVVTPLLCLWQDRVAVVRRTQDAAPPA
jgi:molybdopterin biosynthesis enzyme